MEHKIQIEKHLEIIGDYFKNKLLTGDYKLIKVDEKRLVADLLFDNTHKMNVWIANNPEEHFEFYPRDEVRSFAKYFKFRTKESRLKAYNIIEPIVEEFINTKWREDKLKKIKELENELQINTPTT